MTQDGDISKGKAQKGDVLPWVKHMEKAMSLGEGWGGGVVIGGIIGPGGPLGRVRFHSECC